jgi:hypothetical protein
MWGRRFVGPAHSITASRRQTRPASRLDVLRLSFRIFAKLDRIAILKLEKPEQVRTANRQPPPKSPLPSGA